MTPPPPTRRYAVVDVIHGIEVPDPYRWLEDGDADEVNTWVEAQNSYTRQALDARPDRGWWHERLVALMHRPVVLAAAVRGPHLFTMERPADAEQFELVRRSTEDAAADPVVLVDPSGAAADATVAVDWFHPSADGAQSRSAPARAAPSTPSCASSTVPTAATSARRSRTRGPAAWPGTPMARGSPTPATRRATSTTGPSTITASGPTGATTRSSGPSIPIRRRGRTSPSRLMAAGCSSPCSSAGPASTSICSTVRPGHGRR